MNIFKCMVFRLMENAFASKNTLRHFYSLPSRQNIPPGFYHHSQVARETFFENLSSQQKERGNWDK